MELSSDEFVVKIRNDSNAEIRLQLYNYFSNERDYDYGLLPVKGEKDVYSKLNYIWYARDPKTNEILQSFEIQRPGGVYHFRSQPRKEKIEAIIENEKKKFVEDYKHKTQRNWITVFPRTKTMHHIWDTIKIGAKQTIQSNAILWNKNNPSDLGTTEFTLETISESPKIFLINNCLSDDEVDKILELSKGKLKRSTIVSEDGSGLVLSDIRTSSTCWIKYSDDPVIENIFNRIADILKIDRNIVKYQASELLQVVNYQKSQEFKHHHDYLDPVYHIGNNAVMRGNNRMATFLFYLVTPEEGGETDFPLAKTEKSNDGLSLTLPKGSAILFYSMLPDGNLDELSLHAGLPVQKGEKSIANLWVWDRFFK